MNIKNRSKFLIVSLALSLNLFISVAFGQYTVGQSISQESRDRLVNFCANGAGTQTVGQLLSPGQGEAVRVLWLNFFESW
ncbi:MAG: hypothetical protein HQ507_05535 [Candidatus Marinimicrobia bacterium]|nr:hypothetical protein [Candidatus Neomarinimicrobiota bacterium]